MNVLFISYNGLLEPILSSQAIPYMKDLARSGYRFTLLTYEKRRDLEKAGRGRISAIESDLGQYGIEWIYLRYHKDPPVLSTLFDLAAGAARVLGVIRSKKIGIVHVRGITPGIIMILLSGIVRVKVLFDMRGLLAEEYVGGGMWREGGLQFRLVKAAEKMLLSTADAVTVLTQRHMDLNRSLEYLSNRNIPMDVIPCCVDTSKFYYEENAAARTRDLLGLTGRFVLMYPGKLGSFYFVDEMLGFFKSVLSVRPGSIFFVLTNDDPGPLEEKAREMDIPIENIMIRTGVSFDEMPSYMRIADAGVFFINPYKKLGSSPIKMGEFLASGVPVVINPGVGDTESQVRSNGVGVVVGSFDAAGFSRAVDELFSLEKDREGIRNACRETALKILSKDMAVSKYLRIYDRLSI